MEQILWTVANNLSGTDPRIIHQGLRYLLRALGACVLWWVIVCKLEAAARILAWILRKSREFLKSFQSEEFREFARKPRAPWWAWACFMAAAAALLSTGWRAVSGLKLGSFVAHSFSSLAGGEDFIARYYRTPAPEEIAFKQKNDLVLVLAESFERSFFNAGISSSPLESRLLAMAPESRQSFGMTNASGLSWTIGATTGWHFGLPLKLPGFVDGNQYGYSSRGFLPGARSVFDVLRENGYDLILVMGSDSSFSGARRLFSGHGQFEIRDLGYWTGKGWSLAQHQGTGWGFNDRFVLERAAETYREKKRAGRPFALFVETIDTHAPNGWCPPGRARYQDVRDAFAWSDENLASFVKRIAPEASGRTVLGMAGDHFFMGEPAYLKPRKDRRIFCAFWGAAPAVPPEKRRQRFTALDMAPTILQAAGARWGDDQFGLGISLFSREQTLAQRLGLEKLNDGLARESPFYQGFY